MALSANVNLRVAQSPYVNRKSVVDGAIHIYRGAILNHEAGNVGNVKLGSDTLLEEFAGIALEEWNIAAGDNTADGTYKVECYDRGCGLLFELTITSNITVANIGDKVYVDGDDKVDLSSGILNTTGGFVGIIREFISTNKALVQLTDDVA